MYHVSAQGVDERMINVDYYYYVAKIHLRSLSLDEPSQFTLLCEGASV